MAAFTEDFLATDQTLHSYGGWSVVGENDGTSAMRIDDNYAVSDDAGLAVAHQETTNPTQVNQEIRAWFVPTTEAASTSSFQLGFGGEHNETFADRTIGVYAQLDILSNGERVLKIAHEVKGASGGVTTEPGSLTVVNSAAEHQTGFHGKLLGDGATGIMQEMRVILTEADGGLLVRVYLNNGDDSHPTLSATIRSDWVNTNATDVYGYWWFGIDSGAAIVGEIYAQDYSPTATQDVVQRGDQPTLCQLREKTKRRYEGAANTNLNDQMVDEFLNDSVDEIVAEMGDMAHFRVRTEARTLTTDDERLVTLPNYMERVIKMERTNDRGEAWWDFYAQDSAGSMIIRLDRYFDGGTGREYRITYVTRANYMSEDDDQCIIPRKYNELVVVGACKRLAERDRSSTLINSYTTNFGFLLSQMKRDANRLQNQKHGVFRPRRRSIYRPWPRFSDV